MKKKYYKIFKIVIILFVLYPVNCFADYNWKEITKNPGGHVYYVDLLSIKRLGDNVFYLRLRDFIKPDQFHHLSSIIYIEHNCLNFEHRYLKDLYFQKPMGNGEPSTINKNVSEWKKTSKNSVHKIVSKFVCNYK